MNNKDIKILIIFNLWNFIIYGLICLMSNLKLIKIPVSELSFYKFVTVLFSGYIIGAFYYWIMFLLIKIYEKLKYLILILSIYYVFNYFLNFILIIYYVLIKKTFNEDTFCIDANYILTIIMLFSYLLIKKYFYMKNTDKNIYPKQ